MCLVQLSTAQEQYKGHHVGAKAPAATAADAASSLPAAVLASEPYCAASKWQSPYAMLLTAPAHAGFASPYSTDTPGWQAPGLESGPASLPGSFSGSSSSSGHWPGRMPAAAGSVRTQGAPPVPATPQSPHSTFNIPDAAPQAPHSAFDIPFATLTHPLTAEWGCTRPVHSSLQQQPSMHHDQQSAQAAPLSFSNHQQYWTVPGQPVSTLRHCPSSLKQPYLAAQQQREGLVTAPQQILNGPHQSLTSPHVASGQLQTLLFRDAPAITLQRVERTSNAVPGTHHHFTGSYQLCSFIDSLAGADHAVGLQSGLPCFESGMQARGQQLNYSTNVGALPYIPTSYCAQNVSRAGVQLRSSPALPGSSCTHKTGQQASQQFW